VAYFLLIQANMKKSPGLISLVLLIVVLLPSQAWCARSSLSVKPLYKLSDFSGTVPYRTFVRMAVDRAAGQILVLDPGTRDIRIYNDAGMETYRTDSYGKIGMPLDFVVNENGSMDLLIKTRDSYAVQRCNYRGEIQKKLDLTDIPEEYSDMSPSRILRDGKLLYLVDLNKLKIAVFGNNGRFVRGILVADLLKKETKLGQGDFIFGITVDREANLYFTIPTKFRAYRLSPEGQVKGFGMPGSVAGRFSVVSGIAVGADGDIFLTDRNRNVVMVFSPDLNFLFEFGHRGLGPGTLIVPDDLAFDASGKLYVSQLGQRGVKVYRILPDEGAGDPPEGR